PPPPFPSTWTVPTRPSIESFQCRYRDGSVRKSTIVRVGSVMCPLPSAENDPEHLGGLGPQVLPPVRAAAVGVGAAIVVQGDLAFEDVEQLHLARIEDDLLGLHALGAGTEGPHHGADLALEQAGPEHVPLLGAAVERDHRVVALPRHVAPPLGRLLE